MSKKAQEAEMRSEINQVENEIEKQKTDKKQLFSVDQTSRTNGEDDGILDTNSRSVVTTAGPKSDMQTPVPDSSRDLLNE